MLRIVVTLTLLMVSFQLCQSDLIRPALLREFEWLNKNVSAQTVENNSTVSCGLETKSNQFIPCKSTNEKKDQVVLICTGKSESDYPLKCLDHLSEMKLCQLDLVFEELPDQEISGKFDSPCRDFNRFIVLRGPKIKYRDDYMFITDLVPITVGLLYIQNTPLNSGQLRNLLQTNFNMTSTIQLGYNDNFGTVTKGFFDNYPRLNQVYMFYNKIDTIESNAAKLTERLLTFSFRGEIKHISSKAVEIMNPKCRKKELEIKFNNCNLNARSLESDIIVMNSERTNCSDTDGKSPISIDLSRNSLSSHLPESAFAKLIKSATDENITLEIKLDELECCRKQNEWIFNLSPQARSIIKTTCKDLGGSYDNITSSTQLRIACPAVNYILYGIIFVVVTLIVFAGIFLCSLIPKRNVILLKSATNLSKTSKRRNSHKHSSSMPKTSRSALNSRRRRRRDEQPERSSTKSRSQNHEEPKSLLTPSEEAFIAPRYGPSPASSDKSNTQHRISRMSPPYSSAKTPRSPLA